jgi:hypothetical protein
MFSISGHSLSVPYLIAIVSMVGLSIFGIATYAILTPDTSHVAFIGFVSALVGPLMVGLLALVRTEQQTRITKEVANEARAQREEMANEARAARMEAREDAREAKEEARKAKEEAQITRALTEDTHKLVNSKLDEFKDNIEALATERGHSAGVQEGRKAAEARTDALHTGRDSVIRHEGIIRHEETPEMPPKDQEDERELGL